MNESRLFTPIKIGNMLLNHRVAMAPLTRLRATHDRTPTPLMKEYYTQRASVPGTLIITEGTIIAPSASGGFAYTPGFWSKEQVSAWKLITDEVHRKECFILCQLFAMGRAAEPAIAASEGLDVVGPSPIRFQDGALPRAMTVEEVQQSIRDFAEAAKNAIEAGFDGVEVHGANGYLIDQFIQDVSNKRDDDYGGNIANRSRLLFEILGAVIGAIGKEKVGLRLSPWSTFQGMKMHDPIPQFSSIVHSANKLELAYLHLVSPRISGAEDHNPSDNETLDFAMAIFHGPLLIAGGFNAASARELVDESFPKRDIVVVFGRHFLANPDLVHRLKEGVDLNKHNRKTFYVAGSAEGYVDYPFSEKFAQVK
ncbi:Aldolase-type TIM barrel [Venturia nashicola]|uniref:Aldolase-type TIM barrel n=1 Tax=Venturia nashicola TaxID=86259 RepID=A0A4Z1P9S2_9PEZI|nr:Aldolase-type TIM barrel [Venturia nashicola]TLD38119.1 Aldolase-type TIM barrel [Venturia nashicola]